jgi:hypothetical protein
MSNSQYATEPVLGDQQAGLVQNESDGASSLLKSLLIGFAATVTIGLALASWYVGERILAAHEVGPVSTAVNPPAKVSSSQPAVAMPPPALARLSIEAPPPPPDLYLQVAGLGPRQDASFVKELEAKGYRASIQSAANQEDNQILIGPFAGQSSLEKAERQLQSAGVLAREATR